MFAHFYLGEKLASSPKWICYEENRQDAVCSQHRDNNAVIYLSARLVMPEVAILSSYGLPHSSIFYLKVGLCP